MTFKKKTMVSLCMVAITFVLAIFGVVGIFAISNVKVVTNMSVTYTSNVVGATYGLSYNNYKVNGAINRAYTYVEADVSLSSVGSNPLVTTTNISNDYTQLDTENTSCIWRWEFKNLGSNSINATLTYEDTGLEDIGVTIEVCESTQDTTPNSYGSFASVSRGSQTYFDATIKPNTAMRYFYIRYTLNTKSQYAELSGKFNWTLAVAETEA